MKKNIIFAAFAAASAFLLCASCQKQELIEQNNVNASGKTFTATIKGLTKTTITSEYKVNWETGDQIDINGSIFSATPDASDATKATFTKDSGSDPKPDYTAVYPASIMVETQATLPATQTYAAGKFNAPMCAISSTESLEFKNFCGVLCFALKGTDKVKSIAVTANEQLCGPFEFADATSFSFTEENKGYTVTLDCGEGVQLSATDSTNFYISLPPATYTAGMKIVITNTEGKTIEKTTTTAVKIERNNLYTFDWTATFAPAPVAPEGFVDLGVKDANGKPLYWAEKNLGASKPEEYGKYYSWGDVTGQTPSENKFSTSFNWNNDVFGQTFQKVAQNIACPNGILAPAYDAATVANSSWRTPTKDEFVALAANCVWIWCDGENEKYNNTAVKGYIVYKAKNDADKGKANMNGTWKKWNGSSYSDDSVTTESYSISDTHIFFPAAGIGNYTSLFNADSRGYYWSSTLITDDPGSAYYLLFDGSGVDPQINSIRCNGYSVRPVKDAAKPLPAGALKGEFSVSADKKVHFSQGNLQATYSTSTSKYTWGFAANQYSYIGNAAGNTSIDSQTDGAVVDLFGWSTASTTYGISNSTTAGDYSGDFVDWGKAVGDGNTWRTLSSDEWTYLFNTRTVNGDTGEGKSYQRATINSDATSVYGVILYPDGYTSQTAATSYTSTEWESLENAGCVFLPAAGFRISSIVTYAAGEFRGAYYWSSTAADENGYALCVVISSYTVNPGTSLSTCSGNSVRLITDAPQPK